jgi:hypothetical protein
MSRIRIKVVFLHFDFEKAEKVNLTQRWANLDQASKDLDKTIFGDLSPTPIP